MEKNNYGSISNIKKNKKNRLLRTVLVFLIFAIILVCSLFAYSIFVEKDNSLVISEKDLHHGCYYGDSSQKKIGTPKDWVLLGSGSKSAMWCSPKGGTPI